MSEGLILAETGTQRMLGYVLDVGCGDGRARVTLEVGEAHLNRHGALHGGIATLLLDTAAGATASLSRDETGRLPFVTISFTTQFLAPARSGRVTATGRVAGGGRSLVFVDSELTAEDGRLIALGTGVFKPARVETPS